MYYISQPYNMGSFTGPEAKEIKTSHQELNTTIQRSGVVHILRDQHRGKGFPNAYG